MVRTLGFVGLLVISFVTNLALTVGNLSGKLSLLPPNYLQLSVLATLGLNATALFTTIYFVATGEECLKALGTFMFNLFEPVESILGISIPTVDESLAFQPLMWIIVLMWATAHTVLGQNPLWYAIPVFFDGLWLLHCATKGGSWLTPILAHAGNNLFFQSLMLLHLIH